MAGAPSITGCTNCAAWFHYEDGSRDGVWKLGLLAPCDDMRSSSAPYGVPGATGVTYFAFPFSPTNPLAQGFWIQYNEARSPIPLEILARTLWFARQTIIDPALGPANLYVVVCADGSAPSPGCPPNTYWDNATETCKPLGALVIPITVPLPVISPRPVTPVTPVTPVIPVTPPPPSPCPEVIPCPPGLDPESDELGACCQVTATYLYFIAKNLEQLAAAQGNGTPDPCCLQVVQQLTIIGQRITQVVDFLKSPPPAGTPPIDLTAVVTELTCVCEKLTAISTSSATVANDLGPGLKSISDAIANAPPADLKPLVDVLEKLYKTIDVPFGVYQNLADRGLISPELLQSIGAGEFGAGAVSTLVDFVKTALTWLLRQIGVTWTGSTFSIATLSTSVAAVIDKSVADALTFGAAPMYPVIQGLIDAVVGVLIPTAPTEIGDVHVDDDLILSKTLAPILIVNGVVLLADYLGWDVGEQLKEYVDLAAEFVGLQEVRELKVGQLMRFGPMRVAEMNAKRVYRQEIPDAAGFAAFIARGLLDAGRYGDLAPITGIPFELQGPTLEAAHSGLNARMMIRLAGTGLFSDADVVDELTFGGMRPASQHRLTLAAAYLGSQPERSRLRAALERLFVAGLVSDNDLRSRLESAEHNTDRTSLVMEAVQLEKQIALAKEYEAAYSHEFTNGLLDPPGYQSALEGLGMQPVDVAARLFRDESHVLVTQTLGAERAARASARALAAVERRTSVEGFRTGTLDEAGLSAALTLSGLSPAQVAAEVAYQILARSGVLRWIYGRQLPPSEATLLRQQVADLTRQREIELLTDPQYSSRLSALGIPPIYIQALRAGANAHISPKTAAILTPPTLP